VTDSGHQVIFFVGEFDKGHYKLVLNLQKVEIILSAHIGIIWANRQVALQNGGDFKFVNLSKMVYAAFDSISLTSLIDIHGSEQEAVSAFIG